MGYEVISPPDSVAAKPIVVHIPHSSTCIPARYRHEICLGDAELTAELLAMTDRFTDQLFGQATRYGATLFVNGVSRLVMDPERFPDDHEEPMAAKGMGAVYVSTSNGRPMRATSFSAQDRQQVMDELYWPYSHAFHKLVADHLNQFGKCLVIDAHSFSSRPLPYEAENLVRPDICFGYDVFHKPMELLEVLESICMDEGLTTAHNQPFSGSYVPAGYYRSDRRIHSLMIEVNRCLYMDEALGVKSVDYSRFDHMLGRLIQSIDLT